MAQIVDINGRPLRRETLAEPQTSRIANLAQTFAGHPSRGLTPPRLAQILQQAEAGNLTAQAELFMDMEEKDAHLFAEMSKRKRALLTLDWRVVPPRNASKAEEDDTAWVNEVLCDFADLEDLMLDALDAIGHGFSALELEWQMVGRERLIAAAHHRPQSWFQLARNDQNALRLRDNSGEGAELQAFGWIVHTHRARSGYIARGGLHRVLAWPFLFKNFAVRDLAEFLEIYGLPMRLGKYPPGASPEEKVTLLNAVVSIGHAAAGIIPEGMSIEFEEAAKGASDPYVAMIDWAERSISKAIVGQTTSSEAKSTGMGSGIANLHGEVRRDLLLSDARQLQGTLTRWLVQPLLAMNRGVSDPRRLPRFEFDTGEPEDLKLFAESLPKLVAMGMRIDPAWAHEKLRIPEAGEGKPILALARPQLAVPPDERPAEAADKGGQAAARAALKGGSATAAELDEFDRLAEEMAGDWERTMTPLVSPIERLAEECKTLEEFNARLPQAISQMDAEALTQLLAQGNFAAAIFGRIGGGQAD